MQLLAVLLASASVAHAHYNFNALTYGGTTQTTWQQGMFSFPPHLSTFLTNPQSDNDQTSTATGQ
jgi:hypothetical protein